MPIHRRTPVLPAGADELIQLLTAELAQKPVEGDRDVPDIYEREEPLTGKYRSTVVWDEWEGYDLEARGGLIKEAYRRARGDSEISKIILALGLTRDEADSLRVGQ